MLEQYYYIATQTTAVRKLPKLLAHLKRTITLIESHVGVDPDLPGSISSWVPIDMPGFNDNGPVHLALRCLAEEVLRVALRDAVNSPLCSFMWDGVTDKTSRREKGMLWLRHLDASLTRPVHSFLANVHLPRTDSSSEVSIIKDLLAALEIDGEHLKGAIIASTLDGASVNLGQNHSIMTQTTGLAIHCAPHTSALWLQHTVEVCDILFDFIEHLRGIATDLWASNLKSETFRDIQKAFGDSVKEFIYAPKTRWFHVFQVCVRYISLLATLIVAYENFARAKDVGGATAKGRLKKLKDVRYIFLAHFLVDVLDAPRIFNKMHQADDVLVCELRSARMNLLAIMQTRKDRPGPHERQFIENWLKPVGKFNPGKGVAFEVICVGGVEAAQRSIDKARSQIIDSLTAEVSAFLPPGSVLHAFGCFDILTMPSIHSPLYGLDDIKVLATFASNPTVMEVKQVAGEWQVIETTTTLGVPIRHK